MIFGDFFAEKIGKKLHLWLKALLVYAANEHNIAYFKKRKLFIEIWLLSPKIGNKIGPMIFV
jgi:hypothetical protein